MATPALMPTVLILSLSLATITQLQTLAEDASDKAVQAAIDQTNALPCAYEARPLNECSPNIFSNNVDAEIAQSQAILADLRAQQYGNLEQRQADREHARTRS